MLKNIIISTALLLCGTACSQVQEKHIGKDDVFDVYVNTSKYKKYDYFDPTDIRNSNIKYKVHTSINDLTKGETLVIHTIVNCKLKTFIETHITSYDIYGRKAEVFEVEEPVISHADSELNSKLIDTVCSIEKYEVIKDET